MAPRSASNSTGRDPTAQRILLVEDNPDRAQLTERILEQHPQPLQITTRPDASGALDTLTSLPEDELPHLVLLDLDLGEGSGFDVLEAMRNDASLAYIPVVVLTTSNDHADCEQSYKLGANGFLTRPLDHHELQESLHTTISYWLMTNKAP